jgi:hypothetical protein
MPVAANLILPGFSSHVQERKCYNKSGEGKGHLGLDSLGFLFHAMPNLVKIGTRM